ncbi:MAG TPA: phenylalanine--tRNA ligase subunit alpha [Thermoanaerobacterales bacterium]|nr:phenylalanine--tRNA ligase subunit alpha [Thermoanaerobacterales bacterium]
MISELEKIRSDVRSILTKVKNKEELQQVRIRYLGKKGELTKILRKMGELPSDKRPEIGRLANNVRKEIEDGIIKTDKQIKERQKDSILEKEKIDITVPGKRHLVGRLHPLTLILDEIKTFFIGMGYEEIGGPEIELDYYNFKALNIPEDHPARDMQDTFYIEDNILLRTQTSPVQIRVMEKEKPPIKIIAPGRVYRSDEVDATHSPVFHQVEVLAIEEDLSLGDLKGLLIAFVKYIFGDNRDVRFRASYFPFTEPSAELDISCTACEEEGCKVCKGTGWLEVLGCGMVNPTVLETVGYDTNKVNGFAAGMGVERIAMLKYGIDDMRLFYENDLRFINQFY